MGKESRSKAETLRGWGDRHGEIRPKENRKGQTQRKVVRQREGRIYRDIKRETETQRDIKKEKAV